MQHRDNPFIGDTGDVSQQYLGVCECPRILQAPGGAIAWPLTLFPRGRGRIQPGLNIEGNEAFLDDSIPPPDNSAIRTASIEEHSPIAAILGCADARVSAETAFCQEIGELFMVRVAGNVLTDFGLASLEFAVGPLNTPLVMVLGHSKCGAIASTIVVVNESQVLPGRLPALADALEPSILQALQSHPDDPLNAAIEVNVRRQVTRLHTISPVITSVLEAGTVKIVGAVYDLATGKVNLIDQRFWGVTLHHD